MKTNVRNERVPAAPDRQSAPPVTCGLCEDADRIIAVSVDPMIAAIGRLRTDVNRLQKRVAEKKFASIKAHPKCSRCGLFFGGTHAGGSLPRKGTLEPLCQWCKVAQLEKKTD
jgi:hypothetical protein